MSRRSGCMIIIIGSVLLWGAILYVAGLSYPFDTEGEGPWPENYR